ncbi:MAG: hypothetical protein HY926_07805 [Elusimicrobia bacterium]|nr:hypothetical protein [Elusimicrobiota bacterium]
MRHKTALMSCALIAGAAWLLTSQARDSRSMLAPALAAAMVEVRAAATPPLAPAAPDAAPAAEPLLPAAVPEPAGVIAAPGGPVSSSTCTLSSP